MNSETSIKKPTPAEAGEQLAKVRLLSVDVDGVLTDGGIYYNDDGTTFRKFDAKDGMGLVMLREAGVAVTIISAGRPGAIEHRAKRLGISHVFTEAHDKLAVLEGLCRELGIQMSAVAHIGDDVNDLKVMAATGLGIAPANAIDAVVAAADVVTTRRGGDAAVRELCDAIMAAQGGEVAS